MSRSPLRTVPASIALIAGSAALIAIGACAALAQMSPNCERNGRREACALTPNPAATNSRQSVDLIVFADHTVVELLRNESSCRNLSAAVRTCHASITTPPGGGRRYPAFYRGTAYEGGYRHEFIGPGIRISFTYLD